MSERKHPWSERLHLGLSALVVFSGAFLLFAVQPMLAKWLLPALGGSPATWVTCMLFFQTLLVGGYGVAHVATRPGLSRVGYWAFVVLAIGAVVWNRALPPTAAESVRPGEFESHPVRELLAVLATHAGLPYLLLSTVAPLVQYWSAAAAKQSVFRLYAVSNIGSFAALLAYPTLIEPALPLPVQWTAWSWATAALGVGLIALGSGARPAIASTPAGASARGVQRIRWVAFAFVPSVFLLATTSYLTTDIAAVPLLWVVPLALYLLTFVAAFGGAGPRTFRNTLGLFVFASVGSCWNAFAQGTASLAQQLGLSLTTLTCGALLCHMKLVRARPGLERLTEYYVWIAVGGALGGFFVAVLAPLLFNDAYELELALLATYVVLLGREPALEDEPSSDAVEVGRPRRSGQQALLWLGLGICAPVLCSNVWLRAHGGGRDGYVLDRKRSFLGSLRVTQLDVGRSLTHGRIRHGLQLSDPELRRLPTMYFGEGTAVARAFERHHTEGPRSIGVIGLGAGTLAAYGRSSDRIKFYELDPLVVGAARRWFTFLHDSPAQIEIGVGDGRLGLQRDAGARFDILVLDAFTSDAVPVHLLTLEAFRLYRARLAPDGVLLLNVSNRHLAVDRVVRGAARTLGLACSVIETEANRDRYVSKVRWVVVMSHRTQLDRLLAGMEHSSERTPDVVWTDVHAGLWSVLR